MSSIIVKVPLDGVGTETNPFFPKYANGYEVTGFSIKGSVDNHVLVEIFSEQIPILESICVEEDVEVFEKKYLYE